MEFSTKRLGGKEKKKWSTRNETNSVWFGSSDPCQMASLENFKVLRHPLDQNPSWEGSPQPKIEKKKCVLNWSWGKIQCFKPMLFFFLCGKSGLADGYQPFLGNKPKSKEGQSHHPHRTVTIIRGRSPTSKRSMKMLALVFTLLGCLFNILD